MYAGSDFYAGCKIVAGRELCAGSIQFSNSTSCAGCGHSAYTQARHCNMPVERFWQGPNSYSSLPSIHIHFQASQQHLQATWQLRLSTHLRLEVYEWFICVQVWTRVQCGIITYVNSSVWRCWRARSWFQSISWGRRFRRPMVCARRKGEKAWWRESLGYIGERGRWGVVRPREHCRPP